MCAEGSESKSRNLAAMRTRCTRPRTIRKIQVPAYEPWPAGVHECEYSGVVTLWKNTITMPSMEWPEWSELPDMSIPIDDAAASLEAVAVGMWSWWSIFVAAPRTDLDFINDSR